MTDSEIADLIAHEFASPTLGVTEQLLEIHEPVTENGKIKVEKIDREKAERENITIAYLPVQKQPFYFAVYVNEFEKEIHNIVTESRNLVFLRIVSDHLSAGYIRSNFGFTPTKTWNNGDLFADGRRKHANNGIEFEPVSEADEFEDKLKKLLTVLYTEKSGLLRLYGEATSTIHVIMDFHRGNQLLGSAFINSDCLKLLSDLNLEIDFDFAAWGNPFK